MTCARAPRHTVAAALPPEGGGGVLWATTDLVAYGVPVEIPGILARAPAGRGARDPALP